MNVAMNMVVSSNIQQIGYDDESRTLVVTFKPNKDGVSNTYHYAEVPRPAYDELISAESIGGYFGKFVRGKYQSVKVET